MLELDENNVQKAFNVYGSNLLARKVGRETMCYLYNGHADVTALLGVDGTIKGTYYYDAFGNIVEQTGSVNNPIRYAGYQYDDETGLYYCNSRMYDPKIARFLQEDTVSGDPNDPLSLNLYTYSFNNPLKYSDPSGHWPDFSGIGNWISGVRDNVMGFAEEHPWITTAVIGTAFVGLGILTMGAAVPEELAIGGTLTGTELGGMMLGSGLTLGGSNILGTELNDYLDDYTYNTPTNKYAGSFADGFTTGALMPLGGELGLAGRMAWNGVSAFEGSSVGQLVSTGNVDFLKSTEAGLQMATLTPAFEYGFSGLNKAIDVGASINDSISKMLTDSLSIGEVKLPEISMPEMPKFEMPTFEMPKTDFNLGNSYSSIIDELNGVGIVRYGTPAEESFGGNGFTGFDRPVAGDNIGSDLRLTGASDINKIRAYRGLEDSSVLGQYEADPRLVVDMPYVGKGNSTANAEGWLRDSNYYWNEMLERHPDAFSSLNRSIIEGNHPTLSTPVNDATFRSYFEQYDMRGLRGTQLLHHHIGGGGQAVGIPKPLHPGFGGVHNAEKSVGIWGSDSPYAEMLQKLLNK